MEDVERERCDHRIAHRVLLVEVTRIRSRLDIEPGAPLIDQKTDAFRRIHRVHQGNVATDHRLDLERLAQRPIVVVGRELRSRAFAALPTLDGVVVERKAVHLVADLLHQHLRPIEVVIRSATGDFVEAVAVEITAVGGVAAIEIRIVLGAHRTSATPALVAYTEVLHLPGLLAAVFLALLGHRATLGRHVLDPLG